MLYANKLKNIRALLKEHGLDGYIQPVHDEYMSEYPPACNARVEWLTGFSGSAGTVAVTGSRAALFTDGRYTLQAKQEVDSSLYEQHNSGSLTPESWLAGQLPKQSRVGYDPRLFSQDMQRRIERAFAPSHMEAIPCPNLVDAIWDNRPAAPASPIEPHDIRYCGETSDHKRRRLGEALKDMRADAALITAPDAVCWLFNIRARDVPQTPLLLATAMLRSDGSAILYASPARADTRTRQHLGGDVEWREPSQLEPDLQAMTGVILCDPQTAPIWFSQMLAHDGVILLEAGDPCTLPKALKNPTELEGIRNAHVRDGVAVVKLLHWLDMETARRDVSELEVVDQLLAFRATHPLFREPSFSTIAGSGPNGAIVHYRASEKTNRRLQQGELFLLDSGGQYPDGTTDITRTVPIGVPSEEQKDRFTRVLKGHIALAQARFPEGTAGSQLDALARQFLWQAGLDYDHGTGHGVGHFLGVHEGPQRISKRGGDAVLNPGMILSNEPGYYKTGEYGIRIENLVAVALLHSNEYGKNWLGFHTLTCVPIDTRPIMISLMSDLEKEWLNQYHDWVFSQLTQKLSASEQAWLKKRCAPI